MTTGNTDFPEDIFYEQFYHEFAIRLTQVRNRLARPLTFTEKILFTHLWNNAESAPDLSAVDFLNLRPDRVALQDATGQMALLQILSSGRDKIQTPTTLHCDHLITARENAEDDLRRALEDNREIYTFLKSAAARFGIGYWEPGAGIIHQILLENYAFPGGLLIGTDSHTPNAGGLGMLGVGVGGAEAVDAMLGLPWELSNPAVIGIELTGSLSGWASPKDVILKLAGILTTKGATGCVLEYFGSGTAQISCTGKATICNMGAELGATASLFPFDHEMAAYLKATGRKTVTEQAEQLQTDLRADPEIARSPERFYAQVIRIDLDTLEPHINGPASPDKAVPLSQFADYLKKNDFPTQLSAGLIGSCTNSSYEDLAYAASIARQANRHKITPRAELLINPGSQWIRDICSKSGIWDEFRHINARILANACGPCIGQWERPGAERQITNAIMTTYNRNFTGRNDENPRTLTFLASPAIVMAMVLSGDLRFNPMKDPLFNAKGEKIFLKPPTGKALPEGNFKTTALPLQIQADEKVAVIIKPGSERLQLLRPFAAPDMPAFQDLFLLIKVKGKCTTDHISPAGKWLKYRGHLDKISDNLLLGARNAFTDRCGETLNCLTGRYGVVSAVARHYKALGKMSLIVADQNYGEGSSREQAAMEPRHLGVAAVVARSFARIHETNLKKQGVLALTFEHPEDYECIGERDEFGIGGLDDFKPGRPLCLKILHPDGSGETINLLHNYNQSQIECFWAGGALNILRMQNQQQCS
jgi:aconitate hydratase